MDKMETAAASLEGADAVFCGLGTTRKVGAVIDVHLIDGCAVA